MKRLYGFPRRRQPGRRDDGQGAHQRPHAGLSRHPCLPPARRRHRPNAAPSYCRGTWLGADIYHRTTLPAGAVFAGPAVIEQEDTTVWVLPDWQAATLADGTLCLSRQ